VVAVGASRDLDAKISSGLPRIPLKRVDPVVAIVAAKGANRSEPTSDLLCYPLAF
jgi:hypothetical protein